MTLSPNTPLSAENVGPWRIWCEPPPIPVRDFDWHYQHENTDLDCPSWMNGSCASREACIAEIIEGYEDRAAPQISPAPSPPAEGACSVCGQSDPARKCSACDSDGAPPTPALVDWTVVGPKLVEALEKAATWLDDLADVAGSERARAGSHKRWKHDTIKDWARRTRSAAALAAAQPQSKGE